MLTGTPLDLSPFAGLLTAFGTAYILFVVAAIGVALWLPRRIWQKPLAAAMTAGVLVGPVLVREMDLREQQRQQAARLHAASSLFAKSCANAGEKIHRRVEGVDGLVWMKWRPKSVDLYGQYTLDDPYGHDCGGESCILQLLKVTVGVELSPEDAKAHKGVYRYVETTDPKDGQKLRYVAAMKYRGSWSDEGVARPIAKHGKHPGPLIYSPALDSEPIERFGARYGITWDDISTREDREHWIAGGSLKVVDLQTQEVIAERVGYMMDRGLGSTAGFRSPWGYAEFNACPSFELSEARNSIKASRSRFFVQRVLIPRKGQ